MDPHPTRVLLIEDEAVDAAVVRQSLAAWPELRIQLDHARTLQAGIDHLAKGEVDVVLLDLNLPDSWGVQTVARLRESDADVPLVVLTGVGDEETALAALAAGGQDYVEKEELTASLLRRSIRYAIERRRIARENEQLARRLRQAERMESLGALSAGIGFGLNTLLGTIFDRCADALTALSAGNPESGLRTGLIDIYRAAFRAAEMVQQLRDYAAVERTASDKVDLARFVVQASGFLVTIVSPEIDIRYETTGEELYAEVERSELHRILVALVVNAAEAIGEHGGSISVATGCLEADAGFLAQTHGWPRPQPGAYAFLRVADTGAGLAADRLDADQLGRIFDPFYTTKYAGRGLGLASLLGILQRHRGAVHVGANRPAGTVFTLLFPRILPSAPTGR